MEWQVHFQMPKAVSYSYLQKVKALLNNKKGRKFSMCLKISAIFFILMRDQSRSKVLKVEGRKIWN